MISPEEDFLNWFSQFKNSINNTLNISFYYQDLKYLLYSISETGFLPGTLTQFTSQFLDELSINVVDKIINLSPSNESHFFILKDFIKLFVEFSLYGLRSIDLSVINIALSILNGEQKMFFNSTVASNQLFYSIVCQDFLKFQALDTLQFEIKYVLQSTKILGKFVELYCILMHFEPNFRDKIISIIENVSYSIQNTCSLDMDVISIAFIITTLREKLPLNQDTVPIFIQFFLPIITSFLSSDITELRVHSFSIIYNILNDSKIGELSKKPIVDFFTKDEKNTIILSNMKFHQEYKDGLSSLFDAMSIYSTNCNIIYEIWNNNQFLNEAEYNIFSIVFLYLGNHAIKEQLTAVVKCVLFSSKRDNYYEVIDKLIILLSNRKNEVQDQIAMVRETLWNLSFPDSNTPIDTKARKSLTSIIGFEASRDEFDELCSMLQNSPDDYIYILLKNIIDGDHFELSDEEIQSLINQTSEKIINNASNVSIQVLSDFLLSLCAYNCSTLSDDQLLMICKFQSIHPNFYSFLMSLFETGVINGTDLETIINSLDQSLFDKTFFKFIKKIITNDNDAIDYINSLPLKHENILWNLSLSDLPIRKNASKFLCKLYSMNDNFFLKDEDVVAFFLDSWQSFFTQESNEHDNNISSKNKLLQLLIYFIKSIEYQSFPNMDFHPHNFFDLNNDVFINIPNSETMSLKLPQETRIGMIIDYIALQKNFDINGFELFRNDKMLKRTTKIKEIMNNNSPNTTMFLTLNFNQSFSQRKYHHRTSSPSVEIIRRNWIHAIYDMLENNNKYAYQLFKMLPKLDSTPNLNLSQDEFAQIDLKVLFNPYHPYIFFYNMTTMLLQNATEKICETFNFIEYLYHISDDLFETMKKNISNSHKLILNFIIFLKQLKFVRDEASLAYIYVLFLKWVIVFGLNPPFDFNYSVNSLKQFFSKNNNSEFFIEIGNISSTGILKQHLPYPDGFDNVFMFLILNPEQQVRNLSQSVFDLLCIPLNIFFQILSAYKENVSIEFLNLFEKHFNDKRDGFPNDSLSELFLKLIGNFHSKKLDIFLKITLNMLLYGLMPECDQKTLLQFLKNKFLQFDIDEGDRVAFISASSCLERLHNLSDINANEETSNDGTNKKAHYILNDHLKLHHVDPLPYSSFNINGDNAGICNYNRVGLKNLGMTCYLNSTLQQFYNIKVLREAIMLYDGNNIFLRNLANLFFFMKYSKSKYINPKFLIENWTINNNRIDPKVQQDAAEFIEHLIGELESSDELKKTVSLLLKSETIHRIEGCTVDYKRDSTDSISLLDLEVKNLNNIQECIQNSSKPEFLIKENRIYANETYGFIDAKMRTLILRSPKILIIHLKRFDYTLINHLGSKINDSISIYKEIDISPLLLNKENEMNNNTNLNTDKDNNYSLIGVIIHKGQVNRGHYISYVLKKTSQIWLCLDDENVYPVSEQDVLNNASGNFNTDLINIDYGSGYILFYEKIIDKDKQTISDDSTFSKKSITIPDEIKQEISKINYDTSRSKLMCSEGYFNLMYGISQNATIDYLEVLSKYIIDTIPFMLLTDSFYKKTQRMMRIIQNKIQMKNQSQIQIDFINFILDNGFLKKVIYECPNEFVRNQISKMIFSCFKTPNFTDAINIIQFTKSIFGILDDNLLVYSNVDGFLSILYKIHKKFDSIKQLAIEMEWNKKICDMFGTNLSLYFKLNPGINPSYIFEATDLTHFLKLVISLDIKNQNYSNSKTESQQIMNNILNDNFLLNACISKASPKSLNNFVKKYFSQDDFYQLLRSSSFNLRAIRAAVIAYFIIPEKATEAILSFPFRSSQNGREISQMDKLFLLMHVISKYYKFTKYIMKSAEHWIPFFLYNEESNIRKLCLSFCSCIMPVDHFDELFYQYDFPNDLSQPDTPLSGPIKTLFHNKLKKKFKKNSINPKIIRKYSLIFLNTLLNTENLLSQKMASNDLDLNSILFSEDIADQFIQFIQKLLEYLSLYNNEEKKANEISHLNFVPLLELFSTISTTTSDLFCSQLSNLLYLFTKFNIQVELSTIILPFTSAADSLTSNDAFETLFDKSYFSRLEQSLYIFMPHFNSLLKNIVDNIEGDNENQNPEEISNLKWLVEFWMKTICQQEFPNLSKCYNYISECMKILSKCSIIYEYLIETIDKYLSNAIKNNFFLTCHVLNELNLKRDDIFENLPKYIGSIKTCGYNMEEFINLVINCSSSFNLDEEARSIFIEEYQLSEELSSKFKSIGIS